MGTSRKGRNDYAGYFFHLKTDITREGGKGAWKEFVRRIEALPHDQQQSIVVALRRGGNMLHKEFSQTFLNSKGHGINALQRQSGRLGESFIVRVKWPTAGPIAARLSLVIGANSYGHYNMHQLGNPRTGKGSRYLVPLDKKYGDTWTGPGSTFGDRFFLVQPKGGNAVLIDRQTGRPAFVLLDRAKKRMPFKAYWFKNVIRIQRMVEAAWTKALADVFEGKT